MTTEEHLKEAMNHLIAVLEQDGFAGIRKAATNCGMTDQDAWVAFRIGLDAMNAARKLGAKFPHDT